MSRAVLSAELSPAWVISLSAGGIAVLAGLLGHPAIAEIVGGGAIIVIAFLSGGPLIRRLAIEPDPGRQLIWNALLVVVIALALVGVGVMAAAIPWLP